MAVMLLGSAASWRPWPKPNRRHWNDLQGFLAGFLKVWAWAASWNLPADERRVRAQHLAEGSPENGPFRRKRQLSGRKRRQRFAAVSPGSKLGALRGRSEEPAIGRPFFWAAAC